MSTETNKSTSRRFQEEFNNRDWAACARLLAPGFVTYQPGAPGPLNAEAFIQIGQMFAAAFPDLRVTIHDQIAENDRVSTRLSFSGAHRADFQGIPATGRVIDVNGVVIDRYVDDKIAEHWALFDTMELMQQLGVMPKPQAA